MAKNKKKDTSLRVFLIISIFLCLGAVFAGYWLSTSSKSYFGLEKVERVEVYKEEDITSLGETIYNNEIVLKADIHITQNSFCFGNSERPFNGTFNGNGHTVYCDFSNVEEGMSLFGNIDSDAVINNTNFVFGNMAVNGSAYAGIAKVNYGTIKDCAVSFGSYQISNKGIYSAVVEINHGSVINLTVGCTFKAMEPLNEEQTIIGPVCAYNYGTVKNIISVPKYEGFKCTDEFLNLTGNTVNMGIGAVCPVTMSQGNTENTVSLIEDGVYIMDKNSISVVASHSSDIFNEQVVFDVLDFDNRLWQLSGADNTLKLVVLE